MKKETAYFRTLGHLGKCRNLLFSIWEVLNVTGFLGSSNSKESVCNAGDLGSVPGSGRSPREGKGNSLQYSCLGNPRDRGDWWATVHRVTKESDTAEQQQLGFTLSAFSLWPSLQTELTANGTFIHITLFDPWNSFASWTKGVHPCSVDQIMEVLQFS